MSMYECVCGGGGGGGGRVHKAVGVVNDLVPIKVHVLIGKGLYHRHSTTHDEFKLNHACPTPPHTFHPFGRLPLPGLGNYPPHRSG